MIDKGVQRIWHLMESPMQNMVKEFQDTIVGGKINKIAQPGG